MMSDYVNQESGYSMEELLPLVSKLAVRYTGGEHSSVTYEKSADADGGGFVLHPGV